MSRAREIADERLARGEIDAQEHARILAALKPEVAAGAEPRSETLAELAKHIDEARLGSHVAVAGATVLACYFIAMAWGGDLASWIAGLGFVSRSGKPELYVIAAGIIVVSITATFFAHQFSKVLRRAIIKKLNESRPVAEVARALAERIARGKASTRKEVMIGVNRITADVVDESHVVVDLNPFWPGLAATGIFFVWIWISRT